MDSSDFLLFHSNPLSTTRPMHRSLVASKLYNYWRKGTWTLRCYVGFRRCRNQLWRIHGGSATYVIWMSHWANTRFNLDFTRCALMDNVYCGSPREQRSFVWPFNCQEYLKSKTQCYKKKHQIFLSQYHTKVPLPRSFCLSGHALGGYPQTEVKALNARAQC